MADDPRTPDRTEVSLRPESGRDFSIKRDPAAEDEFLHRFAAVGLLTGRVFLWIWHFLRDVGLVKPIVAGVISGLLMRWLIGSR